MNNACVGRNPAGPPYAGDNMPDLWRSSRAGSSMEGPGTLAKDQALVLIAAYRRIPLVGPLRGKLQRVQLRI
jgi:hypothetical protein